MKAEPNSRAGLAGGLFTAGRGTVWWLSLVLLGFVALNSLFSSWVFPADYTELPAPKADWFPLSLLVAAALVFGLGQLLCSGRGLGRAQRVLERLLLAYVLVLGLLWVLAVRSAPVDDAFSVYTHAGEFARRDYSALAPGGYLATYPHQLGLVFYLELLRRLVGGDNYLFIQCVNVGWAVLAFWALVGIGKALLPKDEKAVFTLTLLLYLCLPPMLYTTFVYGVVPGLACTLLAVLFCLKYLEQRRPWQLALAVLCAVLANLFKNNYLLFALAMAGVLVLDAAKNRAPKRLLPVAALLLAVALAPAGARGVAALRSGAPVEAGMPRVLWVAMGLRESEQRAPGWYSGLSVGLYQEAGGDAATAAEAGKRVIATAVKDFAQTPAYAAGFFYEKTMSQWNEPSFASLWVSHFGQPHARALGPVARSIYEGPLHGALLWLMDQFHLWVFGFGCWYVLVNRKNLQPGQLLPLLVFCGTFLFHTVWEAKSQYTLAAFVLLVPQAAAGMADAAQRAGGLPARLRNKRAAGKNKA